MHGAFSTSLRGLPRAFWVLWAGMLINRLGGFVVPFLAIYLTQERGLSVERAGLTVALFGAGSWASGPAGGILADRLGRRATMLLGLGGGALCMVHLGLARHPDHIAVAALLLGLVGDMYRPAVWASIADVVPPEDRLRAFGLLYWAVNLGFAAATSLGGALASLGFLWLFAGDAATSLAMAAVVFALTTETRPARGAEHPGAMASATVPFRDGVFLSFVGLSFLIGMIFMQFAVALPLDMRAHGLSSAGYGGLIAINGVLIVAVQPFATGFISKFRRSRVLAASSLLVGIGFGLTAVARTAPQYAVTIVIWTLGEIAMAPVNPAVVSDLAPPSLRGTYQGVFQMSWGASTCLSPILGSLVLGRLGAPWLWTGCLALGAGVAAAHLAIAGPRRRRLEALRATLGQPG